MHDDSTTRRRFRGTGSSSEFIHPNESSDWHPRKNQIPMASRIITIKLKMNFYLRSGGIYWNISITLLDFCITNEAHNLINNLLEKLGWSYSFDRFGESKNYCSKIRYWSMYFISGKHNDWKIWTSSNMISHAVNMNSLSKAFMILFLHKTNPQNRNLLIPYLFIIILPQIFSNLKMHNKME